MMLFHSISISSYYHVIFAFLRYCRDSVFALSWKPAGTGHPDESKPWRSNVLKLLDAGVTWLRQCCERIWLGKSTRLKARQTWRSDDCMPRYAKHSGTRTPEETVGQGFMNLQDPNTSIQFHHLPAKAKHWPHCNVLTSSSEWVQMSS